MKNQPKPAPAGTCIFCGGGGSREHIIAQWLIRDAELDRQEMKLGFGAEQGEKFEVITERQKIRQFFLTSVCSRCNNGWMSQLERKAKEAITPLLQDEWPKLDKVCLPALFSSCRALTLWMLKTAVTFGQKMSIRVPAYVKDGLCKGQIPPAVMLDLACSELSTLYVAMTNQWTVVVSGQASMRQNQDSFRVTWQVRHLILRVSYFPYTERLQRKPRYPVVLYPLLRIPPDYDEKRPSGIWVSRRRYVYPDVKKFEDETTYRATASLDPVKDAQSNKLYVPW